MAQTLLQICQQASREMGITAPATIISNTDLYAVTLLNLMQGVGQDLVHEHEWEGLLREHSFSTENFEYTGDATSGSTTLAGMSSIASLDTNFYVQGTGVPTDTMVSDATGTSVILTREATSTTNDATYTFSKVIYSFPSGFERLSDDTQWDKTQAWRIMGPNTGQQWQWLKGSSLAPSTATWFRQLGNSFRIFPPITTENYLRFEYVSAFWGATSSSATPTLSTLTADTDTNVYPDRIMIETLKLRWYLLKGTAKERYSPRDMMRRFPVPILDQAIAQDAGAQSLSMIPRRRTVLIGEDSIPEKDYG